MLLGRHSSMKQEPSTVNLGYIGHESGICDMVPLAWGTVAGTKQLPLLPVAVVYIRKILVDNFGLKANSHVLAKGSDVALAS